MLRATELSNHLYDHRTRTGDIIFIVESERIRAHRCVLAALSEKYKVQFYGPNPDRGVVCIEGVSAAAFNEFLQFFYLETVNLSFDHIGEVLDLANQSLVTDFVNECINFLKQKMTIDNLCSIYRLAIAYDLKELKDLCERKIANNTKQFFATEDFVHCDREMLVRILKLDSLRCSEAGVFDACISWAQAACKEKQIDSSKAANLRGALDDIITHVRFASMTLEEFVVRHKSLDGFFTPDESNDIFYMIGNLDGFQSQKFNQMRRHQSHGFLECNRIDGQLESASEYSGLELFNFGCDKTIRWCGFVIASDLVTEVEVKVAKNRETSRKPPILVRKGTNETIVSFVEPIDVEPDEWHALCTKSTGLKGRTFEKSYHQSGEVLSNDTLFTFRSWDKFSVVSQLLFTRD